VDGEESSTLLHKLQVAALAHQADDCDLRPLPITELVVPFLAKLRQEQESVPSGWREGELSYVGAPYRAVEKLHSWVEFTNLIINHRSSRDWIELTRLYTSRFTNIHPHGIEGLFDEPTTIALISALQSVRRNATGPPIR
jgi:hypothetical protein